LLNRQPTLHRLGIQAFVPVITKHNAVSMHPLVTAGLAMLLPVIAPGVAENSEEES